MKKFLIIFLAVLGSLLTLSSASSVLGATTEFIPNTEIKNDFVLGPGKIELFVAPGEKLNRQLIVTNRTGSIRKFKIEVEDFKGSNDSNSTVQLLGNERGPYSLKDFFKPEAKEFTLKHGERIFMPVEVNIPVNAEPGGLYGAVIISTVPTTEEQIKLNTDQAQSQVTTVSRLGTLFFVRVKGPAKEAGALVNFDTRNNEHWFKNGPIFFNFSYDNSGSVHLVPRGNITITNILGRVVGEAAIDPFFAMPSSVRAREVKWDRGFLLGRYTATIQLSRGYRDATDIADTKIINFYVVPWKHIVTGFLLIIALIAFIKFIANRFEFKIQKKR